MHQLESNSLLICFGFGAMTFIGASIYELVIHQTRRFKKAKRPFTFGKWLLNNLGATFCISLVNFIFARFLFFGHMEWSLYPIMFYATFMIGIIPLAFIGGFTLLGQENKNQNTDNNITRNEEYSSSLIKNKFLFDIPLHQIKYIEALQNYVKIAYLNDDNQLKVLTERATLKEIQKTIHQGPIIKCHRSFLVNSDAIVNTRGNSQGLLLTLSDCDRTIPVSRTWVPLFRKD
ncbi:MAG: LytR/AlgR family response regulator transcription factor [Maribacter sp.]